MPSRPAISPACGVITTRPPWRRSGSCISAQTGQGGSVQHEWRPADAIENASGEIADGLLVQHARARSGPRRSAASAVEKEPRRHGADPAVRRSGKRDHERLRHRQAEMRRNARRGRDLQLAGAGPQRCDASKQRGARHLRAAGNDEYPAALVLVAVIARLAAAACRAAVRR